MISKNMKRKVCDFVEKAIPGMSKSKRSGWKYYFIEPESFESPYFQISGELFKRMAYLKLFNIIRYYASKQKRVEAVEKIPKLNLYVRIHHSKWHLIQEDGFFKSQIDTGDRGFGIHDPIGRKRFEDDLFGGNRKKNIIYGYLAEHPFPEDELDSYGSIALMIKNSVKDRTTWVGGDSVNTMCGNDDSGIKHIKDEIPLIPSLVNSPHHLSLHYWHTSLDQASPYIEAQIHGGLMISDVEEVCLSKKILEQGIFRDLKVKWSETK